MTDPKPLEVPLDELWRRLSVLNGMLFLLDGQLRNFRTLFKEALGDRNVPMEHVWGGATLAVRDLDEWPMRVQRDTKPVPTESAKEPSTHPLMRDPSARAQKSGLQISRRAKEISRFNQTHKPAPKREMNSKIKGEQQ